MPRFDHAQKRLYGVFLCKSGETMVTFWFEPTKKGAERVRLIAPAPTPERRGVS
jgi:hypothetical protein